MTPTTEQLKDLLAKVTPGDWYAEDCRDEKREYPHITQPSYLNGGFMVFSEECDLHPVSDCSCNHTCRMDFGLNDGGECEANATLIALAPTLAAEVVRLREALADMIEVYKDMEDGDGEPCPTVSRARQALDATSEK